MCPRGQLTYQLHKIHELKKHFAQTIVEDLRVTMMLVPTENISRQTHKKLVILVASGQGKMYWGTGVGGRNLLLHQLSNVSNFVPCACVGQFLNKVILPVLGIFDRVKYITQKLFEILLDFSQIFLKKFSDTENAIKKKKQ